MRTDDDEKEERLVINTTEWLTINHVLFSCSKHTDVTDSYCCIERMKRWSTLRRQKLCTSKNNRNWRRFVIKFVCFFLFDVFVFVLIILQSSGLDVGFVSWACIQNPGLMKKVTRVF